MAPLIEANQVGKIQEISDAVFNIVSTKTPFMSMINKDPKPHQKRATWQVEKYIEAGLGGVMDGADVESYNSTPREEIEGTAQHMRFPYKISQFSDVTDVAGIRSEFARQKATAIVTLKKMMEARALSREDSSQDNGVTVPNATRGVFPWLDSAAQGNKPVPTDYRPPAACNHTGTLATVTEASFRTQLDCAFNLREGASTLDGFVGISLKDRFDDFTARDAAATTTNVAIRTFNQNAENMSLINVVDFLKFSSGTVRLHPSSHLARNAATGAETDYTTRSGVFLDMTMWRCAFMRKPQTVPQADDGGGPRGYCETILILKCMNPQGHLKVETSS